MSKLIKLLRNGVLPERRFRKNKLLKATLFFLLGDIQTLSLCKQKCLHACNGTGGSVNVGGFCL